MNLAPLIAEITSELIPASHPREIAYNKGICKTLDIIRKHSDELKRVDKIQGLEADLHELLRVAITNPAGLQGFIKDNYPKQWAEQAPKEQRA